MNISAALWIGGIGTALCFIALFAVFALRLAPFPKWRGWIWDGNGSDD